MHIEREFLNRFVTSLFAKPFLILTGNSGTGKTKLAELFASGCAAMIQTSSHSSRRS